MGSDATIVMMGLLGLAAIFMLIFGVLIYRSKTRQALPEALDASKQKVFGDPQKPTEKKSLKFALAATEQKIFGRIRGLFASQEGSKNLEAVEEILYTSDIGAATVQRLLGGLEKELSNSQKSDLAVIQTSLKKEFQDIFNEALIQETDPADPFAGLNLKATPSVWMIVGVNGAGKTTTIGKLSALLASQGRKVLVAAGDTFRAAAGGQLKVWTDRAHVEIFSPEGVKDPSAVAFEAVGIANTRGFDILLVDTAGRLHTQVNLMEELKKMKRVIAKAAPGAPHEIIIVLDGNSGQNALVQAREFHQALGLTGVVLTKMDGTAKGGVAVGLAHELRIPIRFIGVGESLEDLRPFSSREFVDSIFC